MLSYVSCFSCFDQLKQYIFHLFSNSMFLPNSVNSTPCKWFGYQAKMDLMLIEKVAAYMEAFMLTNDIQCSLKK